MLNGIENYPEIKINQIRILENYWFIWRENIFVTELYFDF
jgi:hypothetical protein